MSDVIDNNIIPGTQETIIQNSRYESIFKSAEIDEEGSIINPFVSEFFPICWYGISRELMTGIYVGGDDGYYRYTMPNNKDYLLEVTMLLKIPAITVKEEYQHEYRIAWTENLCNEPVKNASFKVATDHNVSSFDNHYLNIFPEYNESDMRSYNYWIGNRDELLNYNISLPAQTLQCQHPWFFSRDKNGANAFPLHAINSLTNISLSYNYDLRIYNFLRMSKFIDGVWNELNTIDSDVISISEELTRFKVPELWCNFANVSYEEKRCITDITFITENIKREISQGAVEFCKSDTINIESDDLIKCIYFFPHNLSSLKKKRLCHYSVNDIDYEIDPIKEVTVNHGTSYLFGEATSGISSDHFRYGLVKNRFKRLPIKNIHALPFCLDPFRVNVDTGLMSNNNVKLGLKFQYIDSSDLNIHDINHGLNNFDNYGYNYDDEYDEEDEETRERKTAMKRNNRFFSVVLVQTMNIFNIYYNNNNRPIIKEISNFQI